MNTGKTGQAVANKADAMALHGWLALDMGTITAGAATSALLADAGAEVLKIESASNPDPFRVWGSETGVSDGTTSPVFDFTNRNKLGVGLDLKSPEGRNLFLKMARKADVVVENFRRGVMQKLGIAYEDLKRANSQIVLASISSQGETGPDRNYSSYGSTLEATSGLAAMTGYPDGPPVITGRNVNYPDQIVSLFAMGAIVSAVLAAKRNGQGAHIDISQREIGMFLVGEAVCAASSDKIDPGRLRRGNADPGGQPQFCGHSGDGIWVVVTLPDQAAATAVARIVCADATDSITDAAMDEWLRTLPAAEAVSILRDAGAAVAAVLKGSEVLATAERSPGHALAKGSAGNLVKGFPFQSRRRPFSIHCQAPTIGRDTERVLRERFDIDAMEIANLRRRSVITG
ncbi:MAG: CoA transferase [Pseudomonadota bacterium]